MCLECAKLFLRCICRGNQSHQSLQFRILCSSRGKHLNDGVGIWFWWLGRRILVSSRPLRRLRPGRALRGLVVRSPGGGRRRRAGVLVALLGWWCAVGGLGWMRSLILSGRLGVRMILLEVVGMTIVNHWPLCRGILNWRWRVGVFDCIQHRIEKVRPNHNITGSNLRHRLFRWVFAFNLVPLRLLGFCPITHENTVAEPFLFRPF